LQVGDDRLTGDAGDDALGAPSEEASPEVNPWARREDESLEDWAVRVRDGFDATEEGDDPNGMEAWEERQRIRAAIRDVRDSLPPEDRQALMQGVAPDAHEHGEPVTDPDLLARIASGEPLSAAEQWLYYIGPDGKVYDKAKSAAAGDGDTSVLGSVLRGDDWLKRDHDDALIRDDDTGVLPSAEDMVGQAMLGGPFSIAVARHGAAAMAPVDKPGDGGMGHPGKGPGGKTPPEDATQTPARLKEPITDPAKLPKYDDPVYTPKFDGDEAWESPAGVRYNQDDPSFNNRLEHVESHLVPDTSKKQHTVFSVTKQELPRLIDEAWTRRSDPKEGNTKNLVYEVDMGRPIGTDGETAIVIIVRPDRKSIVTAFPKGVKTDEMVP
jgi:hypothetical protein